MDHQTALSSQAVERYTLDELASPEREEFEEHYFTCEDCAAALQEYEVFAANARAVFTEDAQAMQREQERSAAESIQAAPSGWGKGIRTWFGAPVWAPALAALAFAFVLFQNAGGPSAPDPKGERAEWALVADSRSGSVEPHTVRRSAVWLAPSIRLEGMDPKRWASYHWELSDPGGSVVARADGRENPLQLNIPASTLDSGKTYVLKVWGDRAIDPQPLISRFAIDRK